MGRAPRRWLSAIVAAASCAVLTAGPGVPAPARAATTETVTWPEVTRFNPGDTAYAVGVQGLDPAYYYQLRGSDPALDFGVRQEIGADGTHLLHYIGSGPGGTFTLELRRCDAPGVGCETISASPELTVWRRLDVQNDPGRVGPSTPRNFWFTGPADVAGVDVTWKVADGGDVKAQGSETGVSAEDRLRPFGDQEALVDGAAYDYSLVATAETADFGVLTGETAGPLLWDASNHPVVTTSIPEEDPASALVPSTVVYPVADGYGDFLRFADETVDGGLFTLRIATASGAVVFERQARDAVDWAALDDAQQPLPEGVYTATITSTDYARNVGQTSFEVTVSHEVPQLVVWRREVTPAQSLVEVPEPVCGRVLRPGRRDWPTSFGYRSSARCDGGVSLAETIHEVEVPSSVADRYGRVRLTVVGGAARTAPRSRLSYDLADSLGVHLLGAERFGPRAGRHVSPWLSGVLLRGDDRVARWAVGTVRGNKYDVRRFVVKVEYYVLGHAASRAVSRAAPRGPARP